MLPLSQLFMIMEDIKKCSCIVTDGAKAMTGNKTGLVGMLKKNGVNCITLHCIIH